MKRLLKNTSLLLIGSVFGWWLHDIGITDAELPVQFPGSSSNNRVALVDPASHFDSPAIDNAGSQPSPESETPPSSTRFRQLLNEQKFDQALAYYERALLLDIGYQQILKPVFEKYLQACLQQCGEGIFVELVDLWLGSYYEDIPVLLLLAEKQRLHGLPEEAASTLHLAETYALRAGQREDVNNAVKRLVAFTDDDLSRQQGWIELLGFYEYLEAIGLGWEPFRLRQASLYQALGESQRSRELLLELRENDSRISAEWSESLDRLLAESAPEPVAADLPMNTVSLKRRGDHFLVASSLNGVDPVILMIDTGASITTLTRESFASLVSTDFEFRGSRLFNTANGLTQGEIYGTSSLSLGETRLGGLDIAVLDYQLSDGVDGLLGMNVLRNYRFEIDQDKELLYLRPR